MRKIILLLILAVAGLSVSCVQRPKGIASDGEMASVLADIELAEALLQNEASSTSETRRRALEEYIISQHGLTRAEFDSTMVWYARNPDAYFDLCELSEKELAKKRRKLEGRPMGEIETSDVWPYPRTALFSPFQQSDGMVFSVPLGQTSNGDQLRLRMRFSSPADGEARFGVQYVDGESEYIIKRVSNASRLDLTVRSDTARQIERVFGNLSLDGLKKALWADSIHISVIPFDSTQYFNRSSQHKVAPPRRRVPLNVENRDTVSQTPEDSSMLDLDSASNSTMDLERETPRRHSERIGLRHNNSAARLKKTETAE